MIQTEIDNLQDALELVFEPGKNASLKNIFCKGRGGKLWFRGQSNIDWALLPSVFREKNNGFIDETDLVLEFKRRFATYKGQLRSILEWLTLMQHYGVPTRLMDWTESVLVALIFSINGNPEKDGALYIVNTDAVASSFLPWKLKNRTTLGMQRLVIDRAAVISVTDDALSYAHQCLEIRPGFDWEPVMPADEFPREDLLNSLKQYASGEHERRDVAIAYRPDIMDERMRLQKSVFLIWTGKMGNGESNIHSIFGPPVDLKEAGANDKKGEFLCEVRISPKVKKIIKTQLLKLGIDESYVYPELEYQAKPLKDMFLCCK